MSDTTVASNNMTTPKPNLTVTFWGVQGSCPIFPTQDEVDDYGVRIAASTIERTLRDVIARVDHGELTSEALRKMALPENLAEYQRQLGLPLLPMYGGDTTCLEVLTSDGDTLVFDMGTGLRDFSKHALAHWEGRRDRTLHIFASHEHLDHRNGFPFSSIFFVRNDPFTAHIYGTRKFLSALDDRYGMYSHKMTDIMHVDDPIDYRVLSATFTGSEIRTSSSAGVPLAPFNAPVRHVGEPIAIGATTVTPFEVYHGPTQCLGFKVRHNSSTFVFCTDHELRHGADPTDPRQIKSLAAERRVLEQCQDADMVYFDGQYLLSEYRGEVGIGTGPAMSRIDWGHSCIEDVIERVKRCRIRRTYIGHHDPERLWGKRVELDQRLHELCKGQTYQIELARSGSKVRLCDGCDPVLARV